MKHILLSVAVAWSLSACASSPTVAPQAAAHQTCHLASEPLEDLTAWRANGFEEQQNAQAARNFTNCLGHPDPFLRDNIGYEGLTTTLRAGTISEDTRRELIAVLSKNLLSDDPDGFLAPFSALGLSELVRTDRVDPFLTAAERAAISTKTANYIASVSDYRAYSDQEGWRHGLAHGADIAMQLALNENIETSSMLELRDAIAQQLVARSGHAYTHGEPERLARPIYFMATRGEITSEDWTAWFESLADASPLSDWGEAFQSETDLARLHNLKSFARALYINASLSENEELQSIADGALLLLKTLP